MTYYVLSVTDVTLASNLFLQVDGLINRVCHGNPNGAQLAMNAGVFAWDIDNGLLYMCTSTDQTLGGSIWVVQDVVGPVSATESAAGIAEIATDAEVVTGTDDTKFVTALKLAAHYLKAGAVTTITSITGMTTALSLGQGGTGVTSLAALIALIFPTISGNTGKVLSNDGTNLLWQEPGLALPVFPIINQTLAVGTYNVCNTDSLTLTLPPSPNAGEKIEFFFPQSTTGIILAHNGNNIMGLAADMTINQGWVGSLRFTSTGWWIGP